MNMHSMAHQSALTQFDAFDLIVALSLVFSLALLIAWSCSPKLRAWIERPKYGFQANVRSYDKARMISVTAMDADHPGRKLG
jgi:hypothetical protein